MSERMARASLNPFFALKRAQRAGITEKMDRQQRRVLVLIDQVMIDVHQELADRGCPVFPRSNEGSTQGSLTLIVPEGARDLNTLLAQPMDEDQHEEVLFTMGLTLRDVYSKTGYLPTGIIPDSLAVAFESESSGPSVYLVPPYTLAQPDERRLAPEMFAARPEWQDAIWRGWSNAD